MSIPELKRLFAWHVPVRIGQNDKNLHQQITSHGNTLEIMLGQIAN